MGIAAIFDARAVRLHHRDPAIPRTTNLDLLTKSELREFEWWFKTRFTALLIVNGAAAALTIALLQLLE